MNYYKTEQEVEMNLNGKDVLLEVSVTWESIQNDDIEAANGMVVSEYECFDGNNYKYELNEVEEMELINQLEPPTKERNG